LAIKQLFNKTKNVRIKDLLHDEMTSIEDARSIARVHSSDLTHERGFCPREVVLSKLLTRPRLDKKIDVALRYTFDEGRDKQWRLNNDWLRRYMIGDWQCTQCGWFVPWSRYPVKRACQSNYFASCSFEYREAVFKGPNDVSGSIDAVVDVGLPKLRVVECKILSDGQKEVFRRLIQPMAEHRIRTRLYLKLIAESDFKHKDEIDTDTAHVIYMISWLRSKRREGGHESLQGIYGYPQ
jgi:hypothetical protein